MGKGEAQAPSLCSLLCEAITQFVHCGENRSHQTEFAWSLPTASCSLPSHLTGKYLHGLYNKEYLLAGGGVSIPPYGIQLSFHFRQGLNSFSKPFSLVNKPSLLIVPKHILICQIKKGKSSFVPTFPSCSTLLLFPFTVKCLKIVIYTILYFNFNSLFNPVASNPSTSHHRHILI